jgi:hypothetical protein
MPVCAAAQLVSVLLIEVSDPDSLKLASDVHKYLSIWCYTYHVFIKMFLDNIFLNSSFGDYWFYVD